MGSLIIETSRIKVCGYFYDLCEYCGFEAEWADGLWSEIIQSEELYEELTYYLVNHTLQDKICIKGYSLTDLYVFQMNKYNLVREIGKNPPECNKERMVMKSFKMMSEMIKDPDTFIKRIEEGKGEDRL